MKNLICSLKCNIKKFQSRRLALYEREILEYIKGEQERESNYKRLVRRTEKKFQVLLSFKPFNLCVPDDQEGL